MSDLTTDDIRKLARLSRLSVRDDEAETLRSQLGSILDHIEQLRQLDLDGVEPLARPGEETNRLAADEPSGSFPTDTAMSNAPDVHEEHTPEGETDRYFKVPRVLGEGGA